MLYGPQDPLQTASNQPHLYRCKSQTEFPKQKRLLSLFPTTKWNVKPLNLKKFFSFGSKPDQSKPDQSKQYRSKKSEAQQSIDCSRPCHILPSEDTPDLCSLIHAPRKNIQKVTDL